MADGESLTISLEAPRASSSSTKRVIATSKGMTMTEGVPGSVPLSMPASIHQPRRATAAYAPRASTSQDSKGGPRVGKRRLRRIENSLLSANPHALRPTASDLLPRPTPPTKPLFSPPPSFLLPRPLPDPTSSKAGHYTLSITHLRRNLKKSPPPELDYFEDLLVEWLGATTFPPLFPANTREGFRERSRDANSLQWIVEDSYSRFGVHALARWYGLSSFSVPTPGAVEEGERTTHIVRRWFASVPSGMDTPPGSGSEWEESSASEWDSGAEGEDEGWVGVKRRAPPVLGWEWPEKRFGEFLRGD